MCDQPVPRRGTQRSARSESFNMMTSRVLPATQTVIGGGFLEKGEKCPFTHKKS